MENIYVLDYTKSHFTNEHYVDASFIEFAGSNNIAPVYLTSSKLDLEKQKLSFRLNFDNADERDFISNNRTWPIFSERLIGILSEFSLPYRSFLVSILDVRGRPIEKKYFAMQIDTIPGLVDLKKSVFTIDKSFPHQFSILRKITFTISSDTPQLFRIEEYPAVLFARQQLRDKIEKGNLSGVLITETSTYDWSF
jgi:hypothetical protein